ncbi:MAG: FecR domain-containing protein [Spongiibacteraceae bacterium]
MNIINIGTRQIKNPALVSEQARYWVVRLDGGGLTSAQRTELSAWLALSEFHRKEFLRIAELWGEIDSLVADLVFSEPSLSVKPQTQSALNNRHTSWFDFGFSARFGAVAFSLVLLVLGLVWGGGIYPLNFPVDSMEEAHYVTTLGETKDVGLPDGSTLLLNTRTKAQVVYTDKSRLVRLVGEAYFKVEANADKPFVVLAGDVAIRAVGTAFTVYLKDDNSVDVTVTEGTVELSSLASGSDNNALSNDQLNGAKSLGLLAKGQQVLVQNTVSINSDLIGVENIDPEQLKKKLSWRTGMLDFNHDRMEDVLNEINRYSAIKIVVLDPAIKDIRVGGYFPTGETRAMLSTLEKSFGIHVENVGDNLVYLSRKTNN